MLEGGVRLRSAGVFLAGALAAVCLLAGMTPPAQALVEKIRTFDVPASPGRGVGTVKCQKRKHVFGGGVSADAASQRLIASFPIDGGDRNHKRDDGWRVKVDNIGSADTAQVAAVCGKQLPRYRKQRFEAAASDNTGETASCLEGHIVGGGVDFAPTIDGGLINSTFPLAAKKWRVVVDNRTASDLRSKAYAVCAKGHFRIVNGPFFGIPMFSTKFGFATCPGGKQVTGGGAISNGGFGQTSIGKIFPFDGADGDLRPDDAWKAELDNFTSGEVDARASAVCVK